MPDTFAEELESEGVDQFNEGESIDVDLDGMQGPQSTGTSTIKQLLTAESPHKPLESYEGHPMDTGRESLRHMLRGIEGMLGEVTEIESTRLAVLDLVTGVFKLLTEGGGGKDADTEPIPTGQ